MLTGFSYPVSGAQIDLGGAMQRIPINFFVCTGNSASGGAWCRESGVCNHRGIRSGSPVISFRIFLSLSLHLSAIIASPYCFVSRTHTPGCRFSARHMSGERPAPLWPEGLRKEHNLPPVENQRRQTPPTGESSVVAKQGEDTQPREQRGVQRSSTRPLGQELPGTSSSEQGGKQAEHTVETPRPRRQRREQREEAKPTQPIPPEQSGEAGRKAGPEHEPQLRELAKYLFGGIGDEGASELIAMATKKYPELPPDEALRKFDRDSREGFSFP
jgi:hypothetical protein